MKQAPRLSLQAVSRDFGAEAGVHDLSLEIEAGEVVCLLGPSGCGKSTTLRIAAGVERQDSGTVLIDGAMVSGPSLHLPPERRAIGLMFQEFALFPHLTVAENVAFGLQGRDKAARAGHELQRVGLGGFGEKYPHMLSGGEQQRVALARALAPKPKIMLMDEPFSALDNRLRDQVRDDALALLKEQQTAVLLVTHDPDEAMRMGDRIALMRAGRIIQIGAPYYIYNHPVDRRAAAFFSDLNVIHGIVAAQQTETAFGRFFTPGLVDEADVEIIIRPQHLKVDRDRSGRPADSPETGVAAEGVVERARFMGSTSLIEVRMGYDGSLLKATVPGAFLPDPGERLWLSLRRDRCFVFPCRKQRKVPTPYLPEGSEQISKKVTPADHHQQVARA
ncbi:MAG: ABC transporter ATP-binding protein [Neomegalonema sp.]|nr:ABC transporter ATP-binding protein [Neomegalonema sp.]